MYNRLSDFINLQNGYAFKSKDYSEKGYFVKRITNVQKGYISNHNPRYIDIKPTSNLKKFILKENDILISLTGNVGRVGIIKKKHLPCVLNQRVAKIDIINKSLIRHDFLFLLLNSDVFLNQVKRLAHGTAQDNVSTKDILNIKLKLPSLIEQRQITNKINEIFLNIENFKTNNTDFLSEIKNLEKLVITKIIDGYKNKKFVRLEELASKITDGVHKTPKYTESGIPFIKINNLTSSSDINFINTSYISKEDHLEFKKKAFPEQGDILITKDGTIGVTRLIKVDFEFSIFVSVALIKPKNRELSKYLFSMINSSYCQQQLQPKGTALKHIYIKDLKNLLIPLVQQSDRDGLTKKIIEIRTIFLQIINSKEKVINLTDKLKSSLIKSKLIDNFHE